MAAWRVFILSHGDEDSELVTHVVQLMVQLTTRVGLVDFWNLCRASCVEICSLHISRLIFLCLAGLSGSEELQHLRHLQDQC